MVTETELRRQATLTRQLRRTIAEVYGQPVDVKYIIYFQNYRAFVNGDRPRLESKVLKEVHPHLLEYSLEMCYTSIESACADDDDEWVGLRETIKHGLLARKSVYVDDDPIALYTIDYLEVTELYDKCVLELERPHEAEHSVRRL